MDRWKIASVLVLLISFILSAYFYPFVSDVVATHWNEEGVADGSMPKMWGLFLLPITSLIIFGLFILIPKIDPLKKNIEKFRKYYGAFIFVILLFFLYVHILTLAWNLGYEFNMSFMLIPSLGVLFIFIGFVLKKAKRNWFIGIRTPWTLSSDKVWDKTHQLGGLLFQISGLICLIGLFFPGYMVWFVLIPVLGTALIAVVYSYFEYQKMPK